MIRSRGKLSPEVRALLDEERHVPAQPVAVRARVMARARAALVAGVALPAAAPARAASQARWAVAAALVCMVSAAVVVAAYGIHAHVARLIAPIAVLPVPVPAPARVVAGPRAPEVPAVVAPADDEAPPAPPRALPPPRLSRAEALRSELRLLRHARAAVVREDFAAALVPIAEHARRFKDGRLAEEREALRVKALVGLGRTDDARSAAAAFRTRFPHSVLLPAVGRMSAAGP